MASTAFKDGGQLAAFRRLISDARDPLRISKNPLARIVCGGEAGRLKDTFRVALESTLYRLPPRQRAVVARYDIERQRVDDVRAALGLSRRQFFRDHRAALKRLASLMLPCGDTPPAAQRATTGAAQDATRVETLCVTPAMSLARGLQNAGSYGEALGILRAQLAAAGSADSKAATALDIAELCVESGRVDEARTAVDQAKALSTAAPRETRPRCSAHIALIEGHLASSHVVRQARYEFARSALEASIGTAADAADGPLLVATLHAIALSHDHQGRWPAARKAAREATVLARRLLLDDSPLGLVVAANYAMRDARQFGHVDAALGTLRACLASALQNGWVAVMGDITVHFINLNLMRSRYGRALQWGRWISALDHSRLTARTRNFLAVDTAHALTMLGYPDRAQNVLQAGNDEGLAFHGAREFWRAEALQATGDVAGALVLAARALDGAAEADSQKGRARSKRVLARCEYALGRTRSARKTMEECLGLCEEFVSPYDLLLSIVAAHRIELNADRDEKELARLLRGSAGDAEFGPPGSLG